MATVSNESRSSAGKEFQTNVLETAVSSTEIALWITSVTKFMRQHSCIAECVVLE